MPSGAKKRKAAKRKKEQGIIHHHPPNSPTNALPPLPQGNDLDDDGKDSESGDAGSPNSQDNHPLTEEEGEEAKKEGPSGFEAMENSGFEAMESSENGGRDLEEAAAPQKLDELADAISELKQEVVVAVEVEDIPPPPPSSPPPPLSTVPDDAGGEFVHSEKEGDSREDESPTEKEVEGSAEESVKSVEQTVTITEEVAQVSEPAAENPDTSVGMDAPSSQSEVKVAPPLEGTTEPSPDAVRPEIKPKTEVASAPLAERRASLCSCCGLFDVLMGSQR